MTQLARILLCGALLWSQPALTGGSSPGIEIRDITGRVLRLFAPAESAHVILFVSTDCPISNSYAPTIQRVCREYAPRGIGCTLIYEDVETDPSAARLDEQVRQHLHEYGYEGFAAAVDRQRLVARHASATVTPQAVVVDRAGLIQYRGRIDNLYAAPGKRRQHVTTHDLRDALDAVVSGRKVLHPETHALGCHIIDPAVLRRSP